MKTAFRYQSLEPALWTSPEFPEVERGHISQGVIAGFLTGKPRWAIDLSGNFLYGLDAKGKEMKSIPDAAVEVMTEISRAFDAGNYANAYESSDLDEHDEVIQEMKPHERVAFILAFFASYTLDEISHREEFDECYHSETGAYVMNVAGYCDLRAEEYAADGVSDE